MIYMSNMHFCRVNGDETKATMTFVQVHRSIMKQKGLWWCIILQGKKIITEQKFQITYNMSL